MKSLTQLIALSVAFFTANKEVKEVFATEDGQLFLDENRAKLHKKSVEKMAYHKITRAEALASKNVKNDDSKKLETLEDEVAKKTKELEALELPTKNYQLAKSLVQFFEIEVADLKAETLNNALIAYKQKISE